MTIDPTFAWAIFVSLVLVPYGFFLKRLANDLRDLEGKMTDCQTHMLEKYVMKSDYTDDIHRIEKKLDRIFDLLERKADK